MAASLKFGRDRRLLKPSEFKRVYDKGRRIRGNHLTLFCLKRTAGPEQPPPEQPGLAPSHPIPWRLGLTASRKAGGAVARNRMRRRVREFFRVNQPRIPAELDYVINLQRGLDKISSSAMTEDLQRILERLKPSGRISPASEPLPRSKHDS